MMTTLTTPKTAAFRSLLAKAEALHAEICTLDTAIRDRDAIRTRIGDCQDEAEARKHLGDLNRAEETVIIKQARLPRQQSELADLLEQAFEAYGEAHTEWYRIIEATPKQAAQAFRDLLHAAQLDPEHQKVEKANPVVVDAIRPLALASMQDDLLTEAWRGANITSDVAGKRVEGFQSAIKSLDKIQVAHAEVIAEDKRMVAACEAFRKVLAKG
jgi:hypothetical protein